MREHNIGVIVRLTNPDIRVATMIVTENSLNTRPVIPPINTSGINTAASERVILKMVNDISLADLNVASRGDSPKSSILRTVFSKKTIASSTKIPMAIVNHISDKLFKEYQKAIIKINVSKMENGNATVGITVSLILPKNRNITNTTSPKAI